MQHPVSLRDFLSIRGRAPALLSQGRQARLHGLQLAPAWSRFQAEPFYTDRSQPCCPETNIAIDIGIDKVLHRNSKVEQGVAELAPVLGLV